MDSLWSVLTLYFLYGGVGCSIWADVGGLCNSELLSTKRSIIGKRCCGRNHKVNTG